MPTLTEYQEQRGELVTQARAALNEIDTNTDESRVQELEQRHDVIMADLDKLDAKIKREQRVAQIEKEQEELRARKRPTNPDGETGAGGDANTDHKAQYRGAFEALLRAGCDVTAVEPEQRELLRRGHQELRTQIAGTAAAGGYTVPIDMANEIVKSMKDWGPMYDSTIVREIMTGSGNEFDIPTNDDTGNTAAALAEGNDLTDDGSGDLTFGSKRLDAYVDATPWVKISFELMQDSAFPIAEFVQDALGERLGRRANLKLTTGTGAGQPNGIVTASSLGVTCASTTAIAADEVLTLVHSVNAAYRRSPKCRFQFPDSTLLALRKLKDGQGNYLWQMGDIRVGQPSMILDFAFSINDDIPAIATGNKTIIFGDHSRYWVRKVGGPLIGSVRERFWPKIGIAGLIRYDGELTDTAAVKHLKLA